MSLELTIVMLIASWLAVATAMLWGVLRISRRHHPRSVTQTTVARGREITHPKTQPAAAH
ncbi:hypothetical protein KDX38_12975 [Pseudomonas sp. CDFA 602]|uniref:hypothetical protein n=1 Tax=Pseudomonas californiensis TaxID=2829823 RepID=UPI001E2B09D0|nr:hypothetical protein [Pseudomonas californiensis]MCD5994509.1 hypothetical protein [Pseudomonas californiensis]MCD6000129.1 hypothetical protein [Pseudomonas californiensis]